MNDMKPIYFSKSVADNMIRAILDGRKTVTRWSVKDAEKYLTCDCNAPFYRDTENGLFYCEKCNYPLVADGALFLQSHYSPGDILYVQEAWRETGTIRNPYAYKADEGALTLVGERGEILQLKYKWRPSIHMPREAARIFLQVTDVRVERLHEITVKKAQKEGFSSFGIAGSFPWNPAIMSFQKAWNNTVKPADRAIYGWDANPWCWIIEFERISKEDAEKCNG